MHRSHHLWCRLLTELSISEEFCQRDLGIWCRRTRRNEHQLEFVHLISGVTKIDTRQRSNCRCGAIEVILRADERKRLSRREFCLGWVSQGTVSRGTRLAVESETVELGDASTVVTELNTDVGVGADPATLVDVAKFAETNSVTCPPTTISVPGAGSDRTTN